MREPYLSRMAKRGQQCSDPCWPLSQFVCICLLGGAGLSGARKMEVCTLSFRPEMPGTLEEPDQKMSSTKVKILVSLDDSLFAKTPKAKGTKRDPERNKDIAFLEAQIYEYVEILGEQRQLTRENVQHKQDGTGEEQEEEGEEPISESESGGEENEIITTPKT